MKRMMTFVFALVFILCSVVSAYAGGVTYEMQIVRSNFYLDAQNIAVAEYRCNGDATTENITITITLEKRTLLLFWNDVETGTITSNDTSCSGSVEYQLTKSGTYRCTIVYEVTSTDGTVESKEYQEKIEYDPA